MASASHELRAPLHTIIGMGELLGRSSLTPAQEQYLDALRRAAKTLASMLENAFDGGTADVVASSERLWLPDIMEAVVAIVRDRAAASRVALDLAVAPDVPRRLLGDALRLQQILINLMVNAVKYTPGGSVALRVLVDGDPGGARVTLVFEVEDTGAGIEREALDRIFDPHYRLPERPPRRRWPWVGDHPAPRGRAGRNHHGDQPDPFSDEPDRQDRLDFSGAVGVSANDVSRHRGHRPAKSDCRRGWHR